MLLSNRHGHPATPRPPRVATAAQKRAVQRYYGANLKPLPTWQLEDAARLLAAHPDSHGAGWSAARSARVAVEAEVAGRADRKV